MRSSRLVKVPRRSAQAAAGSTTSAAGPEAVRWVSTATTNRAPEHGLHGQLRRPGSRRRGRRRAGPARRSSPRLAAARIPAVVQTGLGRQGSAPVVLVPGPTGVEADPAGQHARGQAHVEGAVDVGPAQGRTGRPPRVGRPVSGPPPPPASSGSASDGRPRMTTTDRRIRPLFSLALEMGAHRLDGLRGTPATSPVTGAEPASAPGQGRDLTGAVQHGLGRVAATARWAPGSARRAGCRARGRRRGGAGTGPAARP